MSSSEIVPATAGALGVEFTTEQVALVKRTICKPGKRDATNDELALFIGQCKRTGLDPFARQIYAVFRRSSREGREVMTIQVGIDGLRLIAERSGHYLGQVGPLWCGQDGVWRETWFAKEHPMAAKVIVRKVVAGQIAETPAVAHWGEYAVTGNAGRMWSDKPALMLAKCAEALALRKAFPNDMSGLYTDDEMQRADAPAPVLDAAPPAAEAEPVDAEVVGIDREVAVNIVERAAALSVLDKLPLAVGHVVGRDVIGEADPESAIDLLAEALTSSQAERVGVWLDGKAQAAAEEVTA